jgi:hypothetical protein
VGSRCRHLRAQCTKPWQCGVPHCHFTSYNDV